MKETNLFFPCSDLSLEGTLTTPDGKGPYAAVVVCHPHPFYGGDMHNNVVVAISNALVSKGIASFRFNFRGVGESEGNFNQGIGEQEDVRAAVSLLRMEEGIDLGRIGLAGYSFGAGVVLLAAAGDERVQAVAAISPAVPLPNLGLLRSYLKPKLVLYGSKDDVITLDQLQRIARELPEPKETEVVSGADHFWWDYEESMANKVADFFSRTLLKPA